MALPSSLFGVVEMLPQMLLLAQVLMYVVLSWIFGSFAFRGMRKRIPFALKLAALFGVGFLCVIAGAAIRNYMAFFSGTIFELLQIDLLIGGLIASLAMAVAFYLITRSRGAESDKMTIRKLEERVKLLEGFMVKNKIPVLKEDEVRKTAEMLVPGFTAKQASLKGTDWKIVLEKGDKKAAVVFDAYTGDVKMVERAGGRFNPLMLAGIAIIICLAVFSLLSFRGLPTIAENIASLLGMSPDQFSSLMGSKAMPEGCVPTVRIVMSQGISVIGGEDMYKDDTAKRMIENATGRDVMLMYNTDYEGKNYTISITLPKGMNMTGVSNDEIMQNTEICTSISETLCDCIKIPELSKTPMTGLIVAKRD